MQTAAPQRQLIRNRSSVHNQQRTNLMADATDKLPSHADVTDKFSFGSLIELQTLGVKRPQTFAFAANLDYVRPCSVAITGTRHTKKWPLCTIAKGIDAVPDCRS